MNKNRYDVVIIGGGASGLFLAAELPAGRSVCIVEAGERVGKKLLSTGNGKCNLTNLDMNIVHYNRPSFVEEYLDRFDAHDTIAAFERMGLLTKVIDKRVYPYSESAASVLDVLRRACERNGVETFTCHIANNVDSFNDSFTVSGVVREKDKAPSSFSFAADSVVLAVGSNASTGRESLALYTALGHTVRPLRPSLAPIKTDKEPLKGLSGVRVKAGVRIGYRYEVGEVLFKEFGLSGIAAFNMSSEIARCIAKPDGVVTVDFMPELSQPEVETVLRKRGDVNVGEMMTGTFHSKVIDRILWAAGAAPGDPAQPAISRIASVIKNYPFKIEGVGDASLAQVMSGGLNVKEFDSDLMSTIAKNAYATGEALDVDGDSGGYNLQWAWTSAKTVASAIAKKW